MGRRTGDLIPAMRRVFAQKRGRDLVRSSPMAPLRFLLCASLLVPALLFAMLSWRNYSDTLRAAGQELRRTVDIAREHAGRVFDVQTEVIDRANDLVRDLDVPTIDVRQEELHTAFANILSHLPLVRSMLLTDVTGHPLVSAVVYPVPQDTSLKDRDYFQAIVAERQPGPFISHLQIGAVLNERFFSLSRPWLGRDDTFRGVISVAVSPDPFERFYRALVSELPLGASGNAIALIRADGELLARFPPLPSPVDPQRVDTTRLLAAIAENPQDGTYEAPSNSNHKVSRFFAYRKIEGYPVYVVADRRRDVILASWRNAVRMELLFGVPVTLALAAVTGTALIRTGRERHALALARAEIGRRERAEAALLRAQRLEAVGQMTGGVAHDFNNLLTVILGSAELLERRATDPARVRSLAAQIVLAARRGGTITQQLLTFARRQFVSPEIVDLNQHLRDFQPLLDRAAGDRIVVALDLAPSVHHVRLDPGHFEAAILNLVGNARDAISGEGRIVITTRDATVRQAEGTELVPGDYVRVAVSDNGSGMDRQTAARAFEPFFTTKGIGQGTGLGLSQVYGFAKQAGGDARISTAPGQGTTVALLLPCAEGELADAAPQDVDTVHVPPPGDPVVLIVEDDAAVLETVAASLHDLGYSTLAAPSADAALDLLRQSGRVDLLFSDVVMPGRIDGVALAGEAQRLRPGLRVLLSSGYTSLTEDTPAPGIPLLPKPYDRDQLAAALRGALADGVRA